VILSDIYRYPVKSLAGSLLLQASLGVRGIEYDRHWMLIDRNGRFLSQRQLSRMALIQTEFDGQVLNLSYSGMDSISITIDQYQTDFYSVKIWQDTCVAQAVSDDLDHWFGEVLQVDCRCVFLPKDQVRQVDQKYAEAIDQTGFSDGFPLLLISQASLDDLNQRLPKPVSMLRFRPNLVISGCEAFAEDGWRIIQIGGIVMELVKPCSRCVITTIDPQTGLRDKEPLFTLASYRKRGNKVMFGQNVLHRNQGLIERGMTVKRLD